MTTQPAAQVQPIEAPEQKPQTYQTVGAVALGNVFGGLGLALITAGILWIIDAPTTRYNNTWVSWILWTGALMVVRFSHDEGAIILLRIKAAYWKAKAEACDKEADALDALLLERDRTIDRQAAQIANKRNFVGAQPDRLSPRMNDAIALVRWKYGDGIEVTQRWAQREKAWSTKRYGDAMQVLGAAKIVAGEGNAIKWAKYDSPAVALIALDGITLDDSIFESNQSSGEGVRP